MNKINYCAVKSQKRLQLHVLSRWVSKRKGCIKLAKAAFWLDGISNQFNNRNYKER